MAQKNEPVRVVFIGDPGATEQQIVASFSSEQEFKLIDIISAPDRLIRDLRAADAEIILIDYQLAGQLTLDSIDDLAVQFTDAPIVAILPKDDPVQAQQVMLAGARAFIYQPFTQINLLSTLRRVRDLEGRYRQSHMIKSTSVAETARPLKVISVFSSRGGVGCTTVAANLALALLEETNARILLMEGKLFFGHLNVMLNLRPHNTIADLIPHANNLDEGLVHDVIIRHATGLNVLLAPTSIQVAQGIRPDDLYSLFMGLQKWFDYVVVDAGSSLSENTVTLMDASDRILLVANPDLASLHDTSRFIQISRSLAFPPDKMMIVLNRDGMPGGVRTRDIEAVMHYPLFAQIPEDSQNVLRSLNRGVPLIMRYPRSPATRAIRQMARTITSMSTAQVQQATPTADKARKEALLASSRLG